jgi:hypothetical protein
MFGILTSRNTGALGIRGPTRRSLLSRILRFGSLAHFDFIARRVSDKVVLRAISIFRGVIFGRQWEQRRIGRQRSFQDNVRFAARGNKQIYTGLGLFRSKTAGSG